MSIIPFSKYHCPLFPLPIYLGHIPGSQAPIMQMDNSLSAQLSHVLIICSLLSCWQGVGGAQESKGLSWEQVGNKTVSVVPKGEDVRVEPPHPFVTMHWSMTAAPGLSQEWLMNYPCLSLADACNKCAGWGLEWNKRYHLTDRYACSENESHCIFFFEVYVYVCKDLTLTEQRSFWFTQAENGMPHVGLVHWHLHFQVRVLVFTGRAEWLPFETFTGN